LAALANDREPWQIEQKGQYSSLKYLRAGVRLSETQWRAEAHLRGRVIHLGKGNKPSGEEPGDMAKRRPFTKVESKTRVLRHKDTVPSVTSLALPHVRAPIIDPALAFATPRRKRNVPEVMTPLSMRLRRSVHVRFIEFADEKDLSYPDALEALLNNVVPGGRVGKERVGKL
jgi:hypothetical protein